MELIKTMIDKQHRWIVCLGAICAVTIIEVTALISGINGTLLVVSVTAVAGLGGYSLARATPGKD
jgi:hypothetical protein